MMELVHASADMVREELFHRGSKVTTASVYNILSQLADFRIYGRRLSATNKMFFDVVPTRHIHMYDREGNTWRDLVDEDLDALVNAHLKRRRFKGFTIEDIDIQLIARPTRKSKN
jgi:Fe2+ or Zn2+ uptake regulation protein